MSTAETPEKIKNYNLTNIRVDSVKTDKANPNKMTMQQMFALEKSMHRFGYLTPIIVDEETMTIADGHHRYLVYKELGYEEIPAYVIRFKDENERRMLRQIMNKLHGQHDKEMDAAEFLSIIESSQEDLAQIADAIAQPPSQIEALIDRFNVVVPSSSQEEQEQPQEQNRCPTCGRSIVKGK